MHGGMSEGIKGSVVVNNRLLAGWLVLPFTMTTCMCSDQAATAVCGLKLEIFIKLSTIIHLFSDDVRAFCQDFSR